MSCLHAFSVSFLPVRTSYETQTTLKVAASNTIRIPFPIPISRFPPWLSDLTGIIYHCSVRRTMRRSVSNIPPSSGRFGPQFRMPESAPPKRPTLIVKRGRSWRSWVVRIDKR